MWRLRTQQQHLSDGDRDATYAQQHYPQAHPSPIASFRELRQQHVSAGHANTPPPQPSSSSSSVQGAAYRAPAPIFASQWAPYANAATPPQYTLPFDTLSSLYQANNWGANETQHTAFSGGGSRAPPSAVASANTSVTSAQHEHNATKASTHQPATTSSAIRLHSAPPPPHEQQPQHSHHNPTLSSSAMLNRSTPSASAAPHVQTSSNVTGAQRTRDDLVHSRSFVGSNGVRTSPAQAGGSRETNASAATPVNASTGSIAVDIEALQARMVSLSTVNVQLQQDLEAARHEAKRVSVDNSRLRDQLQIASAQEVFLKSELEKVVARQQQLLSFEHTPMGLGKVEVLEHQNKELKDFIGHKEGELRTMQTRLQESMQRVQQLNAALVEKDRSMVDVLQKRQAPQLQDDSSDAAAGRLWQKIGRHIPLLQQAHRSAVFSLNATMALRHVVLAPHHHEGRDGQARSTLPRETPCHLTQRHCAMQCLQLAARGEQTSLHATSTTYATGQNDDVAAALDDMLQKICSVLEQHQQLVVSGATELLAKAAEDEAAALLDAAPVPEANQWDHNDDEYLISSSERQQLHRTQPTAATAVPPTRQTTTPRSDDVHRSTAAPPPSSTRSLPLQEHQQPASKKQPLQQQHHDSDMYGGGFSVPPEFPVSTVPSRQFPTPSERHAQPLATADDVVAMSTYTTARPSSSRSSSVDRSSGAPGPVNVIRVERAALRRSPVHSGASPTRSEEADSPVHGPSDSTPQHSQQQRPQHRPSIQPPRRGPAARPAGTGRGAPGEQPYGGCEHQ